MSMPITVMPYCVLQQFINQLADRASARSAFIIFRIMGNNKNELSQVIVYILSTTISLSLSYMVYTKIVGDFNFGYALALFSIFTVLTLRKCYAQVEKFTLRRIGITSSLLQISYREALRRNGFRIILHGLLSVASFCFMLHNLTNIDAAMMFILAGSVASLLQVLGAVKFFGDKIEKPLHYYFGFFIMLGGILVVELCDVVVSKNLTPFLYVEVFAYILISACNPLLFRKITTEALAKEQYVPVKTAKEISVSPSIIIGVAIGCLLSYLNNGRVIIEVPSILQVVALIIIGTIVPICGTIASRILNEISQPVARAAEAFRLILGFALGLAFAIYFVDNDFFNHIGIKALGIIIAISGSAYAFYFGKPQKPDYTNNQTKSK